MAKYITNLWRNRLIAYECAHFGDYDSCGQLRLPAAQELIDLNIS